MKKVIMLLLNCVYAKKIIRVTKLNFHTFLFHKLKLTIYTFVRLDFLHHKYMLSDHFRQKLPADLEISA